MTKNLLLKNKKKLKVFEIHTY